MAKDDPSHALGSMWESHPGDQSPRVMSVPMGAEVRKATGWLL